MAACLLFVFYFRYIFASNKGGAAMVEASVAGRQGKHHGHSQFVPTRSKFLSKNAFLVRQPSHRDAAVTYVPESHKPRLLDQVREAIRTRHYSLRTGEAYVNWVRRFILFHGKR